MWRPLKILDQTCNQFHLVLHIIKCLIGNTYRSDIKLAVAKLLKLGRDEKQFVKVNFV